MSPLEALGGEPDSAPDSEPIITITPEAIENLREMRD